MRKFNTASVLLYQKPKIGVEWDVSTVLKDKISQEKYVDYYFLTKRDYDKESIYEISKTVLLKYLH